MTIYTIGFGKRSARDFFRAVRDCGARWLLDIRLKNTSQLAGFTKRDDLRYFLEVVAGVTYVEVKVLAPTQDILKTYQRDDDWARYERDYLALLAERCAEESVDPQWFEEGAVLLCSEPSPEHCHRRLAAEYLRERLFPDAEIVHL